MSRFPPGHFYSPVLDPESLRDYKDRIWESGVRTLPGVDLRLDHQKEFVLRMQSIAADFDYPLEALPEAPPWAYYQKNGFFNKLDARLLFGILRLDTPRRIIEVGSGFSSLLMADVNRRFLDHSIDLTCIEPYPKSILRGSIPGLSHLIEQRVEDVDLALFDTLEANDILFIDSSHVIKTGNDVWFLFLKVLPRLKANVRIHIHDIFLPFEYPERWVLDDVRSWNEQYLLHALLMFSSAFRVLCGSACVSAHFPEVVRSVFGSPYRGGSFWIEKINAPAP